MTTISFPIATSLPEQERATPTPVCVLYVSVPRAVFTDYWHRPWVEVLAAAERGEDGLTLETVIPRPWQGQAGEAPPNRPDVAFLREGMLHGRSGCTLLYQQN